MSKQQQAQQLQPATTPREQTAPQQPMVSQSGPDAPPWWINLVTDRLDAKLEALKSRLEGEIKAVESRLDAKIEAVKGEIKASELRQSEARANQTRWIVATIFGVGLLVFIDRMWPPGAA